MIASNVRRGVAPRRLGSPLRKAMALCVSLFVVFVYVKLNELALIGEVNKSTEAIIRAPAKESFIVSDSEQQKSSSVAVVVDAVDSVSDGVQADFNNEAQATQTIESGQEPFENLSSAESLKELRALRKVVEKYRKPKAEDVPIDYQNTVYDEEARKMVTDISKSSRNAVDLSLLLMARSGHRHRVTHLIGGEHLAPGPHREKLTKSAKIFAKLDKVITPKSSRDFRSDPIGSGMHTCDDTIPCRPRTPTDAHVSIMSMENVHCNSGKNQAFKICGTPELSSDVPLLYVSWHDWGVMKPPPQVDKELLAAAYISNCGFTKRNEMVKSLVAITGGKVRSFGKCEPSGHTPPQVDASGPGPIKLKVLERSKFSLAFENSEATDYITEKFFGSLCASSIPVVIGAPNAKFFAPDTTPYPYQSNAMIHSLDFGGDAERIASLLMELDKNDQAYKGLLVWKQTGYSDDYKALVDIGDVHSSCRVCSATGDDLRHTNGISTYDVRELKDFFDEAKHTFVLFIRERGTYSFTRVGFPAIPSMRELVSVSLAHVRIRQKNLWKDNDDLRNQPTRVYAFYLPRPSRSAILSDQDIQVLPNGCELEMIVV